MLTVPPIFIIVLTAVMVSSQPFHDDSKMRDDVDRTTRVKRQWGDWYSYKFKTPFYKMKIKTPYPYGGNIHPFGGGFGQFGYHPGGYGQFGYHPFGYGPLGFSGYHPGFHMPDSYGWHSWI